MRWLGSESYRFRPFSGYCQGCSRARLFCKLSHYVMTRDPGSSQDPGAAGRGGRRISAFLGILCMSETYLAVLFFPLLAAGNSSNCSDKHVRQLYLNHYWNLETFRGHVRDCLHIRGIPFESICYVITWAVRLSLSFSSCLCILQQSTLHQTSLPDSGSTPTNFEYPFK